MIDVKTAQNLVLKHSSISSKIIEVTLQDALGFVIAKDVFSNIDMPPFRQSAMDGYALRTNDGVHYSVIGEIKAGDPENPILDEGEAVRIFTGAPVPDTANAVIMQEKVLVQGNEIITQMPLTKAMNIRPKGEQIKTGEIAIEKGTKMKGVHIGILASLGVTKVYVYHKPSIAIVVTGNELKAPGIPLAHGEIYESNGAMLWAVLSELGYTKTSIIAVADDYDRTKNTLEEAIDTHDVVIVTGGVSVGDYDFVGKALVDIDVKEIFYKVKQKPGKPLFFGKKDQVSIFGLPGNPAAALSCFYMYVYPLLKKSEGATNTKMPTISMPLLTDYTVKGNRAQFLKASIQDEGVQILGGQSSAMLRAFGQTNVLVFLPENTSEIKKGELVKTILLPIK
jgi:molybdopterin molybdotransferase